MPEPRQAPYDEVFRRLCVDFHQGTLRARRDRLTPEESYALSHELHYGVPDTKYLAMEIMNEALQIRNPDWF